MNAASSCHEIPECSGLYIDAFRGSYLRKTRDPQHHFILTHYHGDHYGNLPRDNKYQGPAWIHCTPITATLLRQVHQVPNAFVVEHAFGQSWTLALKNSSTTNTMKSVRLTFYDANHCPGAAIILIQLLNEHDEIVKVHLHTGDMRYHEKMKHYPLLDETVRRRQLDTVYLDTTYANPKHDFIPQDVAVDSVGRQVEELLSNTSTIKTLVLLSCYSIGKEKVRLESFFMNVPSYHVLGSHISFRFFGRHHVEQVS